MTARLPALTPSPSRRISPTSALARDASIDSSRGSHRSSRAGRRCVERAAPAPDRASPSRGSSRTSSAPDLGGVDVATSIVTRPPWRYICYADDRLLARGSTSLGVAPPLFDAQLRIPDSTAPGHPAERLDPSISATPLCQTLREPRRSRSTERIDHVGHAGSSRMISCVLRACRRELRGPRYRLVEAGGVQALGSAEHGAILVRGSTCCCTVPCL